jgi:nicotinamide-nucleotide amidase
LVTVVNLAVGKELLIGRTLNTNAGWIGGRLYAMGGMLDRILTVTDSLDEISSGLRGLLSRRPDFVIVVGGLGPTPDDMTLKGVAMGLGLSLRPDRRAAQLIKEHLESVGRPSHLTPAHRKMARLPQGAEALRNEVGTAPGVRILAGKSVVFCLPGVPAEMRFIFRHSVEGEIKKKMGVLHYARTTLKLRGVYEASLAPAIASALEMHPDSYIKSHPRSIVGGVPRLELDVVVTSRDRGYAHRAQSELLSFLSGKIEELGGEITSSRAKAT